MFFLRDDSLIFEVLQNLDIPLFEIATTFIILSYSDVRHHILCLADIAEIFADDDFKFVMTEEIVSDVSFFEMRKATRRFSDTVHGLMFPVKSSENECVWRMSLAGVFVNKDFEDCHIRSDIVFLGRINVIEAIDISSH